jgi:Tfp pilus assembly protein PilF
MDNGIVGFGFFIWLIAFVTLVGLRGLNSITENLKASRAPPRAYDLLGYLTALLGMLIHNFTDVSMRFVSSGVYLGLLPGVIINLARGNAIWELHYKEDTVPPVQEQSSDSSMYRFLLWSVRILSLIGLVYVSYLIVSEFSDIQGPLRMAQGGENLQWWISWSILLGVVVFLTYSFANIILKGISVTVPVVIILMLFPLYYFWGWFKGDVYHNMAIFFSKQGKWEDAISYYRKVNKHNAYFIMPYYFTGNVFNDRFNMTRQYRPEWGDIDNIARDDFERAMDAYEKVRKIAPNYVQMHHQVGILNMKMHDYFNNQGKPDEAKKYLDKALARFELYHNLDPVFPYNYYRRAQVYIAKNELEKAEKEYLENINAPKCHIKGHLHESPEAYTNLANLRYVMGKVKESIGDYQRAIELNPGFEPAKRNLEILKQKFSINVVPEIPKKSMDADFEVPSKRK